MSIEVLRWSPRRAWPVAIGFGLFGGGAAVVSTLVGLGLGYIDVVQVPRFAGILAFLTGLAAALFSVGVGGLTADQLSLQSRPNEGIRRSARNALIAWTLGGLLIAPSAVLLSVVLREWVPIYAPAVPAELFFWTSGRLGTAVSSVVALGLIAALGLGGFAVLSHVALRVVLWAWGELPLRLVPFLDAAAERVLLRKVGGGYIFVHRLLLEHFATLADESHPPNGAMPVRTPGVDS